MNKYYFIIFVSTYLTGCRKPLPPTSQGTTGIFMNMEPSDSAKLLAPDLLASPLTEYNGTFSPKGDEFFYTSEGIGNSVIAYTKLQENGSWTEPIIAKFSGNFSDYDPLFSPDGKRLYFSSERPVLTGQKPGKTKIWYVEKQDSKWESPKHVPLTGIGDYFSSITNSGAIYFNTWNTGKILKATPSDTGYVTANLPETINWGTDAGDPFIAPNEDYLNFRSYKNSLGNGDLYISFNLDGNWTTPENLGEPVNSSSHEMCPFVTTDGKYFIWASGRLQSYLSAKAGETLKSRQDKFRSSDNGNLNIYYCSANFIDVMKSKHKTTD